MLKNTNLEQLSPECLRDLAAQLIGQVSQLQDDNAGLLGQIATKEKQNINLKTLNDKLTHEIAVLRRHQYGRASESLNVLQISLLDDVVEADIAGIEEELARMDPSLLQRTRKKQPKRTALPAEFPRTVIRHEPVSTQCTCGCQLERIGEDISEKLDYTPGVFNVEHHVRGKWACKNCESITQAAVPAQVIDKGIPTSGLLAQVLIAKYADHLPLYRQEKIFERAGFAIARSTLADWVGRCGVALQPLVDAMRDKLLTEPILHADETPVPMLSPGKKKTHRAYIWAYANTVDADRSMVIYDFTETRAGKNARAFLGEWCGKLVCDDFGGYKAGFAGGITEIGCMAHARRKFFELHERKKSLIAEQALVIIARLYEVEHAIRDMNAQQRLHYRSEYAKPILDELHNWLISHRRKVLEGTAIAKVIDYSLNRWTALTRYCEDGALPIDNNWAENQIRPWALGRKNWLFAGSLRSGQRAAAVMTLIQSAKLNDLEPYAYLKDVLDRLPTTKASQIEELLPYNWKPTVNL